MPVSAQTLAALMAAGVTGDKLVEIVKLIDLDMGGVKASAIEKRRAWDREYRRQKRESGGMSGGQNADSKTPKSTRNPPEIHPTRTPTIDLLSFFDSGTERIIDSESQKESGSGGRATRLPIGWAPTETDRTYALTKGYSARETDQIAEDFADYWTAAPGQRGRKADWAATWRTWIRNQRDKPNGHDQRRVGFV